MWTLVKLLFEFVKFWRLASLLRTSQLSITAALISHYIEHDAANMSKNGTLGPLLTNCKKSIVFFRTKTCLLQLEMLIRGISWSAAVYSSITLHTAVHGKTAAKTKVKSGSLHQLEWSHFKEAKCPAPVRGIIPQWTQWSQWGSAWLHGYAATGPCSMELYSNLGHLYWQHKLSCT